MADREIYIAIAAAVLGASLILYLLRIVANIFSAFGGRSYYDPRIDDRERNNGGGCFIPFLLFLVIAGIGGKIVYDRFLKPSEDSEKHRSPKGPELYGKEQEKQVIPVKVPDAPLGPLDEDEIPFEDEKMPSNEPIAEKVIVNSIDPCHDPSIIQADFFLDFNNAKKRMLELSEEFNGRVGIYQKDKGGRSGYAVYIGTFCNDFEAEEIKNLHGLSGPVLRSTHLTLVPYELN